MPYRLPTFTQHFTKIKLMCVLLTRVLLPTEPKAKPLQLSVRKTLKLDASRKCDKNKHGSSGVCQVDSATPPPPLRKCNGNRKDLKIIKKKCHKFWLLARNQLNWQELHCCWLAINQKLLFWISVWPVIMKSASTVNGILLKVRAEEILHFK